MAQPAGASSATLARRCGCMSAAGRDPRGRLAGLRRDTRRRAPDRYFDRIDCGDTRWDAARDHPVGRVRYLLVKRDATRARDRVFFDRIPAGLSDARRSRVATPVRAAAARQPDVRSVCRSPTDGIGDPATPTSTTTASRTAATTAPPSPILTSATPTATGTAMRATRRPLHVRQEGRERRDGCGEGQRRRQVGGDLGPEHVDHERRPDRQLGDDPRHGQRQRLGDDVPRRRDRQRRAGEERHVRDPARERLHGLGDARPRQHPGALTDERCRRVFRSPGGAPATAEAWDLERLARARRFTDWAFEQYAPLVRGDVLEVGAGIGTYTQRVLDAGAASVLALEPEPAVATALEERSGGDARVEVACEELLDAPSLQASDGQFDLVLCQNVLEHVADDREALEEIARVLAPGGWLALVVPAHPALYGSLDRAYGHHRRYRREELVRLVGESGLELRAAYPFNLLGVPGWWLSSRRRATGL